MAKCKNYAYTSDPAVYRMQFLYGKANRIFAYPLKGPGDSLVTPEAQRAYIGDPANEVRYSFEGEGKDSVTRLKWRDLETAGRSLEGTEEEHRITWSTGVCWAWGT